MPSFSVNEGGKEVCHALAMDQPDNVEVAYRRMDTIVEEEIYYVHTASKGLWDVSVMTSGTL